jgi:hypothetical protein
MVIERIELCLEIIFDIFEVFNFFIPEIFGRKYKNTDIVQVNFKQLHWFILEYKYWADHKQVKIFSFDLAAGKIQTRIHFFGYKNVAKLNVFRIPCDIHGVKFKLF